MARRIPVLETCRPLEKIDFDGGVTNRSRGSFEACSCGSGTRKRSITRWNAPIVRGEKGRRTAERAHPLSLSLFIFLPLLFKWENARSSFNLFSKVYTPTSSRNRLGEDGKRRS